MNPIDIRKQLRQARNNLSDCQQSQNASLAFQHFKNFIETHSDFQTPQKIALFLAQDSELATEQCINYLWLNTQHQVFLPVLETKPEWHMAFAEYHQHSPMKKNQFKIDEPEMSHHLHLSGQQMDWVFMPLVGFDKQGNRLGMGGGYYDRTFAFKQQQSEQHTQLIGWAHSCQQVEKLPTQDWDVPLDAVLTEMGLQEF